jgi:hypothetical protein
MCFSIISLSLGRSLPISASNKSERALYASTLQDGIATRGFLTKSTAGRLYFRNDARDVAAHGTGEEMA